MSTPTPTHTAVPHVQATAPERIYLVIGEDVDPDTHFDDLGRGMDSDGVTWCADKIDGNSIPYVRDDLASLPAPQGEQPCNETIREQFEASVRGSVIASRTPLDIVKLNGAFSCYRDRETDSMWMGYRAGFRKALGASQDARTSSVAPGGLPLPQADVQKQDLGDPASALPEPPGATLSPCAATYVTCHECNVCGHIGINDAHSTDAACTHCDWRGRSPGEDRCPGCGSTGTMTTACPVCRGRYRLLAEAALPAPQSSSEGGE